MNSFNYSFKDAFYNLEKILASLKTTPVNSSERARLHAINQKNTESSMASGEFLSRARRGETLHQDRQTEEICKEFVRTRAVSAAEESESTRQTELHPAELINEEMPVFGLKASLHASTEHASFENWKNVHHLLSPQDEGESIETCSSVDEITASQLKAVGRAWRDLSESTALRLIDHPLTPGFVLAELSRHPSAAVRAQVADNPNTPKEAILELIQDESADVRLSLAECYHLGVSILEILVDDENPYVGNRAQTTLQRLKASLNPSVIRGHFDVTQIRARA